MIEWLVEAFNPAKFPRVQGRVRLPKVNSMAVHMGESLTHVFGGLLDRRKIEPNENSTEENEATQCRKA